MTLRERCEKLYADIQDHNFHKDFAMPFLEVFALEIARQAREAAIVAVRNAYEHTEVDHCRTRTKGKFDCNCSDKGLGCYKAIQAIALAVSVSEDK